MNIHFESQIAKELGVQSAIMIENFAYWIKKNKANNKHFYDNEYWTYNTMEAFTELFEFWSPKQVRTIIEKLRKDDLIKVGNYNKKGYDRTLWYSFTEKGYNLVEKYYFIDLKASDSDICPKRQMDLPKKANGFAQKGTPIPYTITDTITDKKEKESNKTSLDKLIESYTDNKELIEAIKDFIKMRKSIKKPLTDRALKTILNKLNNFANDDIDKKIYILEQSIEHSWQTVYEAKDYIQKNKATTKAATEKVNIDDIINNLRSEEI